MSCRYKHKFTLLELLVVMFIMVISSVLVLGQLSKLPVFAAIKESSARVATLYSYAGELAEIFNRPFEIGYRESDNSFFIITPLELDDPNYGVVTTENRYATTAEHLFTSEDLTLPNRGVDVVLSDSIEIILSPEPPTIEELLEFDDFSVEFASITSDESEAVDYVVVATIYPNGHGEGRKWQMIRGKHQFFCWINAWSGELIISDVQPEDWSSSDV